MSYTSNSVKVSVISGRSNTAGSPKADPDLGLLLRVRSGDQGAKTCLWDRYWRSLVGYFIRNRTLIEEAEDLASETLLEVFEHPDSFRGAAISIPASASHTNSAEIRSADARKCSFKTYLYSIARFKLYNSLRHNKIAKRMDLNESNSGENGNDFLQQLERLLPLDTDSDPLIDLLNKDRIEEVCCALADVGLSSVEQFKVLLLHYFCDLSHKEISELLSTPQTTVNSRLQKGRERMLNFYHNETKAIG